MFISRQSSKDIIIQKIVIHIKAKKKLTLSLHRKGSVVRVFTVCK